MFDKQKIIRMTAELEGFVRTFPNIYILPETFSANVLSLLKRLNATVTAIITNNPQQNVVRMPSGEYKLTNIQVALPNFQQKTALIISAAKPAENPTSSFKFIIGNIKIELPAFALTDEEALAIYDRLTTIQVLKQYQNDGVIIGGFKDVPTRFARGMSTFIDSQFQNVKVQIWDRREFKIPSYDEVDDEAIVMQGPLEYKDNYTITTARLYRQWYPNAPIVISTWKNEATENFREECRKIGVVLLENELPLWSGPAHINYQLESSLRGVNYVKNNTSAKFVLKCRTDQRINKADFLIYLKNLTITFTPNGNKLKRRIVVEGCDMSIPFFIHDFMSFGNIDDMNKYYGIPKLDFQKHKTLSRFYKFLYKVDKTITKKIKIFSFRDIEFGRKLRNYNIMMSKVGYNEMIIAESFYQINIGFIEPSKLLQTYWKFLRDYVIVCDSVALLMDWPKYFDNRRYTIPSFYDGRYRGRVDFARWLDIYLNYKDENEL